MRLARLKEHPEHMVETPWRNDARGWPVLDPPGRVVGSVTDLIFDTESGEVAYMALRLTASGREVLAPVSALALVSRPPAVKSRLPLAALEACTPYPSSGPLPAPRAPRRPGAITLLPDALAQRRTPAGAAMCAELEQQAPGPLTPEKRLAREERDPARHPPSAP